MGRRLITVAFSLLVIVGISVSLAQVPVTEPAAKALDPEIVAVRLILGIGDATPQDWSGRASVDKGEILDVEGLRFRDGDMVTGRDSWKTRSRLIRKAAAKKAAAKTKKQAEAKAKRQAAVKAKQQAAAKVTQEAAATTKQQDATKPATGPGTTGPSVTPNGVVVALKNVAGATLTVETEQGKFSVAVDRLADGTTVSLLDDRVGVQRVLPHAPLFEGPKQQDFPAAAAGSQGAGAWIAAVWHEPRGPELMPAVNEQPKSFAEYLPTGGGDQVNFSATGERQDGRTAPRPVHRARARHLAPRPRHRRRWQRRRCLDRKAR